MGAMSPWHWAIVLLVVVVLFGSKRLPSAARGLGQSLRIFKTEIKEMQSDGKGTDPSQSSAAQPTAAQSSAPQQIAPSPVAPPAAQPNIAETGEQRPA